MTIALIQLAAGIAVLFVGGHYLVQGATALALLFRISPAVVGLTVVAMGTSMPELAVSIDAAARRSTDIAYANVIGSNIFNVGAILAIAALLRPIPVQRQTVRIEYPFMVLVACLVLLFGRDRLIDHLEGLFFVITLSVFLAFVVYLARREGASEQTGALEREVQRASGSYDHRQKAFAINGALVVFGILALIGGADLVIRGAVTMARTWGIEERVIGLTVVAMGTSLPELATSLVAAARKETEIALSNIVGSNIFNMLAILGITATVFPVPVNVRAATVDNWVMLGFCAGLFPLMLWGRQVGRRDAGVLAVAFVGYMTWVVATA